MNLVKKNTIVSLLTFLFLFPFSFCQVLSRSDIQKRLENVPYFIELYDYDNAMKSVDEVIYNDPSNHTAYRYKIHILCIQKDFDLAVDMVQRLLLIDKIPDHSSLNELCLSILRNGIEDSDSWVQISAAEKLAEMRDTTGRYVLQKIFEKKIARIRVAGALAHLGDTTSIYYLEDVLQRGSPPEKLNAANILADIGDENIIPQLKQVMKQGDLRFKIGIAAALFRLGDEIGSNLLSNNLTSKDPVIQMPSAIVLVKRKDPRAIPVLKTLLENPNTKVRTAAIDSLSRFGDKSLVTTFSKMTENGPLDLKLLEARVRLGDKSELNLLINMLKQDSGVQFRAAETVYGLIKEDKM